MAKQVFHQPKWSSFLAIFFRCT